MSSHKEAPRETFQLEDATHDKPLGCQKYSIKMKCPTCHVAEDIKGYFDWVIPPSGGSGAKPPIYHPTRLR